jgi:hypothetical protein
MAIFRFEIESDDKGEMCDLMLALFGGGGLPAAITAPAADKPTPGRPRKAATAAQEPQVEPAPDTEPEVISKPTELAKPAAAPVVEESLADEVTLDHIKAKGTALMPHVGGASGVIAFLKATTKSLGGPETGGYGSLPKEMYQGVYDAMENKLAEVSLG